MRAEEESKEPQIAEREEEFEANRSYQMPIDKEEELESPLKVSYCVDTGAKQSNEKTMPGSTFGSTIEKVSESSSPKCQPIQDESETANEHPHVIAPSL